MEVLERAKQITRDFFFEDHFCLMSNIFFMLVHWVEGGERERDGGGARCRGQCVNINGHCDTVRVDARQDGLA